MDTPQSDIVTMYKLVTNQYLPSDQGQGLLAIPLVASLRTDIIGTLGLVATAADAQAHPSTGVSRTREEVKREAAIKGDIIRQMVLLFPPSATAEAELRYSPLKILNGDEQVLLAYLQRILDYLPAIDAEKRALVGYDDKQVGQVLKKDLKLLNDTVGEVRQVINTSSSEGTATLLTLFETLAEQGQQLDRVVKMQRLSQPKAVEGYEKARRIIHTAPQQRRRPTMQGPAHFGTPAVVLDRTLVPLLSLTLGNRSAKGYTLGYYLADSPTALPLPGQELRVVKRNRPYHLGSFEELGPAAARYLLVVLREQGPEGKYYVQG